MSAPAPQHSCDQCGRRAARVTRTNDGGLCRSCYRRDPRRFEDCAQCGRLRYPSKRTPAGSALCSNCARPKHLCVSCGRLDHAKKTTDRGPLCQRCYTPPHRICGQCGERRPVAARSQHGIDNLCKSCFVAPLHTCGLCALQRPVHTHWPVGPVCLPCYKRELRSPAPCARCGHTKVLTAQLDDQRICGPCAGARDYLCRHCGTAGPQHFTASCLPCSITRLVTDLLATDHPDLARLPQLLSERGDPASTMRWLMRPHTRTWLTQLGNRAHHTELTHADVDALPPSQGRHFLRALLVETGILTHRDEHIERLGTWLTETADTLPHHHRTLIVAYGHWSILRAARRRAHRGHTFTTYADSAAREQIRTAIRFLAHLDKLGVAISNLTQPITEGWIAGNRDRTRRLAAFIAWLRRRNIITDITIDTPPTGHSVDIAADDDHTRLITTLVNNSPTADLATRVAGLLVLLYGAHISRIHHLTTADITTTATTTQLRLATHPIDLPTPVATLLHQIAAATENDTRTTTPDRTGRYLFPGARPHHPMHPTTLHRKLAAIGITKAHRHHALATLTGELPAAVVATQLGLHINTTTNWATISKRDNAEYLIARQP